MNTTHLTALLLGFIATSLGNQDVTSKLWLPGNPITGRSVLKLASACMLRMASKDHGATSLSCVLRAGNGPVDLAWSVAVGEPELEVQISMQIQVSWHHDCSRRITADVLCCPDFLGCADFVPRANTPTSLRPPAPPAPFPCWSPTPFRRQPQSPHLNYRRWAATASATARSAHPPWS